MALRVCLLPVLVALVSACSTPPPPASDGRFAVTELLGGAAEGFERALAPRPFVFPRDHDAHPAFRSEWWYLTATLEARDGRRFGVQFTIFRQSLAARPEAVEVASRWRTQSAWMAHVALAEVDAARHRSREAIARGALGLAGADGGRVWVYDDAMTIAATAGDTRLHVVSNGRDFGFQLHGASRTPPLPNGDAGLSRKGPEPGNASYYYSLPHLTLTGEVSVDGERVAVSGSGWLDREWSTSVLSAGHVGWDWFALRLDGEPDDTPGAALMVYRLRRADGAPSGFDYAAWFGVDGSVTRRQPVRMQPRRWWRDEAGVRWPVAWTLALDDGTELQVEAAIDDQVLRQSVRYWEGYVTLRGHLGAAAGGREVSGRGYLEMTGYGG